MSFVCMKFLLLNGEEYHPGDIIPDGVILPERIGKLKANKCIAEGNIVGSVTTAATVQGSVEVVTVSVKADEGEEPITLSIRHDGLQTVVDVLQMDAAGAVKQIADIADEDVLILLHAVESRKTVKNAVKTQADTLFSTNGDMNAPRGYNDHTDTSQEG